MELDLTVSLNLKFEDIGDWHPNYGQTKVIFNFVNCQKV